MSAEGRLPSPLDQVIGGKLLDTCFQPILNLLVHVTGLNALNGQQSPYNGSYNTQRKPLSSPHCSWWVPAGWRERPGSQLSSQETPHILGALQGLAPQPDHREHRFPALGYASQGKGAPPCQHPRNRLCDRIGVVCTHSCWFVLCLKV